MVWGPERRCGSRRVARLLVAGALTLTALVSGPLRAGDVLTAPALDFVADTTAPDLVHVEVSGLETGRLRLLAAAGLDPAGWASVLSVVARDPARTIDQPPQLVGRWSVLADTLRFDPRFPPSPGLELEARFHGSVFDRLTLGATTAGRAAATPDAEGRYRIPELDRQPATRVLAVDPGTTTVPANLLRLYVHFSAPMSARHVVPHVRLLDAEGQPIPTAFVEIPEGLWDRERRRLTLLVHPGRVKRGVGPHTVLGPVLEAGGSYSLEISRQARDSDALPLVADFVHTFHTGTADHHSPDPLRWRLTLPKTPADPLVAHLDEPADRALLERLLWVETAGGEPIAGRPMVDPESLRWSFRPELPWPPGAYRLVVPHALEDPSGNRVDRLFEESEDPSVIPADPVPDASAHGEATRLDFVIAPSRGQG